MLCGSLALLVACTLWLPAAHLLFAPRLTDYFSRQGIPPQACKLAARHIQLWTDPALRAREVNKMRVCNAEWDFMGRTFLVLSLANMSLREPRQTNTYLEVMDHIIDETIRLEREKGIFHFMMDYARESTFVARPPRSLFLDGEIALMLGARRIVRERDDYKPLLRQRIEIMTAQMQQSPVLSGESYPNECWTFCNSVALAAMRVGDVLDGSDHSAFIQKWIAGARRNLIHKETGILVSSYNFYGYPNDGPEGSSIWMVSHCLALVDEPFALDQYERGRKELARRCLGFDYAAEWPRSWHGPLDVDSGPVIPVLEASPSSSGLALIAANTFQDPEFLSGLLATLNFGAFPIQDRRTLHFAAGNQVGEAVILYAMVLGPLWDRVKEMQATRAGPATRKAK